MTSRPARIVLTIVMNLTLAAAVATTLRLGVRFWGHLAAQGWGKAIIALTDPVVIPFGLRGIKTPYGGVFDVNAAIMVGLLIIIEWVLSGMRDRD